MGIFLSVDRYFSSLKKPSSNDRNNEFHYVLQAKQTSQSLRLKVIKKRFFCFKSETISGLNKTFHVKWVRKSFTAIINIKHMNSYEMLSDNASFLHQLFPACILFLSQEYLSCFSTYIRKYKNETT